MVSQLITEETSLLPSEHDAAYQRFTESRKRMLVLLISSCGLMPFLVSGTFIPSISQIATDLDTPPSVVTLAISLSIFATSLGGLSGAAYSTFYGRRPVYLASLPLLFIGSVGVALSRNVSTLMISRFFQALGASPGMSVGAAVIGDIYKLEHRGSAMGVFSSAALLGTALAPSIGGFITAYGSWRIMQLTISAMGCFVFAAVLLYFPETSHPGTKGIDKHVHGPRRLVFVNPLRPLRLLRSPNLLAVSLSGFLVLLTDIVLLVPFSYTIGAAYHITDPASIGTCFLSSSLGNILGAPLGGKVSDKVVMRWRLQRKGIWYPEDRLRASFPAALFAVPLSVVACALGIACIPGPIGLMVCLVGLFVNGIGVDAVLGPLSAYVVDVLHDGSAEGVAAVKALQTTLLSFSVSMILPLMNAVGTLWMYTLVAFLAWLGYLILWLTVRYGNSMRAWVDVGYATMDVM